MAISAQKAGDKLLVPDLNRGAASRHPEQRAI
jgi:hypothetical protein